MLDFGEVKLQIGFISPLNFKNFFIFEFSSVIKLQKDLTFLMVLYKFINETFLNKNLSIKKDDIKKSLNEVTSRFKVFDSMMYSDHDVW